MANVFDHIVVDYRSFLKQLKEVIIVGVQSRGDFELKLLCSVWAETRRWHRKDTTLNEQRLEDSYRERKKKYRDYEKSFELSSRKHIVPGLNVHIRREIGVFKEVIPLF